MHHKWSNNNDRGSKMNDDASSTAQGEESRVIMGIILHIKEMTFY